MIKDVEELIEVIEEKWLFYTLFPESFSRFVVIDPVSLRTFAFDDARKAENCRFISQDAMFLDLRGIADFDDLVKDWIRKGIAK